MFRPRLLAVSLALACVTTFAHAEPLRLDAQPLSGALNQLALDAGVQILFDADTVRALRAPAVAAEGVDAALDALLRGSGLTFQKRGGNTYVVGAKPASEAAAPQVALPDITVTSQRPALTAQTTEEATQEIQRIPGSVAVVPDTAFKAGPANTIRDALASVPGVITQPKSNIDNRIAVRGSGLTRNYGNRGVNLLLNGVIPVNTSDGLTDVFEIDPSAYRYIEVYKGANALRFGANALGGAINFVAPTGRDASRFDARLDAGSFGFVKAQASTGGASGPWDVYLSGTAQREDGYREHSDGQIARASMNLGYRLSDRAETRFFFSANRWDQRLPGELTKATALATPKAADPFFVFFDQQRNIDSVRLANKTTLKLGNTTLEAGVFGFTRHVDHPIFRYLDFYNYDYGGFVRATQEGELAGRRNRLVVGVNLHNGKLDYEEYANSPGAVKGPLAFSSLDRAENLSLYAENTHTLRPDVALVVGGQFLHAVRDRTDRFLADGDQSGRRDYDLFSPKLGVIWDYSADVQLYSNVSKSVEVPTFDVNTFAAPASSGVKPQRAVTVEFGTRGQRGDTTWDVSVYRAALRDEFQCLRTSPFSLCSVVNADRTVHQGVEAGAGTVLAKSAVVRGDAVALNLVYTFSDFHFDGDPVYGDNQLPGVPRHLLRAEALYKHPAGLYAGPVVEWMGGGFYADNANTLKVDPYTLLNLRAGYDSGRGGWSGYLEGRNLTDKRYISTTITAETANAADALFNPGYGRAFYAGLRYVW